MSYSHHAYARWDQHFPFPELHLQPNEKRSLDSLNEFLLVEVFDRDKDAVFVNYHLSSEVVLLKTARSFEGKYVDYVSSLFRNKILPVGPLVTEVDRINGEENSDIMRWLGKKKLQSTVYVSFGSEYFLSEEEIVEIAKGLELCKANFIWVIRFAIMEGRERSNSSVEEVVPKGFLERMRERGRVVAGWAPQANILGHPSTGAFASHCGWSSLNESIYYGVPVVGMPIKINMFVDARMLVDAGACVEVGREGNGVFKGEEIAKAIDGVIVEERGEGMRRRARELSEKMRMEEEGAIDEVAHQLWNLCCKNEAK